MAATTRWKDLQIKSIDVAIDKLIDEVTSDERMTNISWDNWTLKRVFSENQTMKLNGKDVKYNYISYAYDQTTAGSVSVEDRVTRKEGFIIVYDSGGGVNYIVNQNSSAMKFLRKLLTYTGKNELEKNSFELSNDFFIWLIYRVYYDNNSIEMAPESKEMMLDSIKGIKGDTDDSQTTVSASGETVMNVISTLSFLLESRNLNQVKIDLTYTEHNNISLLLQKGTVNVYLEDYIGSFGKEEQVEQKTAKLYLMVYLEILPLLMQEYNMDIGNELWNQEIYKKFLRDVADTITEKVQSKITSLDNTDKSEKCEEPKDVEVL